MNYGLNHLKELESEAIFILREVFAQFENPVLMFSGGKDSILLVHLANKAFYPAKMPFPLLHVDTGHNFPETIAFRDQMVERLGARLIVASVQEAIDAGKVVEEKGLNASRNALQTQVLVEALDLGGFDAAIGGARRDEEKARAKERIFSHRDEFGQWDPKNQRPELWNLFNSKKYLGEHFRVFPISNWTELDVWQYLKEEQVDVPCLYFAHERKVIVRQGVMLPDCDFIAKKPDDCVQTKRVRCRTIGDMSCTGVWESEASGIEDIIKEISVARKTERGGRLDDRRSENSMEERKKLGYF